MNRWITIIGLATISFYSQAETKNLSSAIKAVTLYGDRAAITRQAEVSLPAGQHELIFANLPNTLDTNSVQVNAEATAPTTILDVTTAQTYKLENTNQRLQKIDEQIKAVQDELKQLADKNTLLNNQLDFINKTQSVILAPSKDASRPTANDLKSIMQLTKDKLSQILTQQRAVTKQRTDLQKQLSALQGERYPLQRNQGLAVKNVTVRVNLSQSANVKLDLTYMSSGANWYPSYDARFISKDKKLTLNYLGVISQRTGEDWQNVKLTLSTAKPSLGGNAPILTSWIVDEFKPAIASPEPAPYATTTDALMTPARMLSASKNNSNVVKQMASVDLGTTSASFYIAKPTSLISGASQQKVAITTIQLSSELNYLTVPRLAEVAYLQAKSTNHSDFPLIAGSLNIFMNNRFITTSQLKTTMPKEELKLELGGDEGINVKFKQMRRFTEKTGFTSSNEKVTYEYLITVQNNKQTDETIKVMDHFPVSQDEKITVKLLSPTPRSDKNFKQDKDGKLTWDWSLKAGEKREATVSFAVEYPTNTKIVGLP